MGRYTYKVSAPSIERGARDKLSREKIHFTGPKWGASLVQNYGLFRFALYSKSSRTRPHGKCGGTNFEILPHFREIAP